MNDKPTKEKMLELLKLLESRHEFSQEGKEILDAILRLIEHGPEVSRNDIEAILENEKTTNAENIDALMDYLEAKGIKIEVEEVACDAIRALILASDKGPEVDREFVDKWRDIIFDYHEELLGEPTADNIVRAMLYEAGVTVKEDK